MASSSEGVRVGAKAFEKGGTAASTIARGQTGRRFPIEKRGDGVPIIREESMRLSGSEPAYLLIDDAKLLLTIHGAPAEHGLG